ncbi:hypothetical protein OGAPHI_003459 [Ogataea philodendri]|uniref:Mitochondrial distribution and morphology protein 10 n=1 Tax=Ogataea philodendri TaxID=1378263 RepID=A0A9P8P6J5_9ASCO|nr:uncharacterized protein OGAPHI_003459 [Ogataea philodendri]KAH3666463.1 hypothetical protein OGAPHI_003459 [Ogataea philodendri]
MEYIQKCFYSSTNWNQYNSYSTFLETSKQILDFPVPSGFNLNVSAKNAEYSYSSVSLSQFGELAGSFSYLYSSIDLAPSYSDSKSASLQSIIEGYRLLSPPKNPTYDKRPALLYGKMYLPSQFLEGMLVKRLSENSQLLVKFINTPKLNKLSNTTTIMNLSYQRQSAKSAQEFVFSTNEALFGLRYIYNLGAPTSSMDSSLFSVGCELWCATQSLAPGMSTGIRYSTHLTSSGKPLTMTLVMNPLLGSIESTYAIKTNILSTFVSKYSFNIYSYESDLSLGCHLWRLNASSKPAPDYNFNKLEEIEQKRLVENFKHIKPSKLMLDNNSTTQFVNRHETSDFKSSLKCSTSLSKKQVSLLWEGKFKDWLLSTGVKMDYKDQGLRNVGYGLDLQYSS